MDELENAIQKIVQLAPYRLVLSSPRGGSALQKAKIHPYQSRWQVERFTKDQAFHQNIDAAELVGALCALLREDFTQLHAFAQQKEVGLRVSKKGKVLLNRRMGTGNVNAQGTTAHDRPKRYLLAEGSSVPPLVDVGIFTADGRVVAAMQDKYRQINRFVEMVDDVMRRYDKKSIQVIDFGCGKAYLTFVLYHYLAEICGLQVKMTGIDRKAEVVAQCNATAARYGYEGLRFEAGEIESWQQTGPVDMVVALHACDTATDYALAYAVQQGAGMIFSSPCCQHELNGQMQSEELSLLTRYGIVKERTAALMTDAIRANLLEAYGYKTQLLEFVDLAHTPKNLLIRAIKTNMPAEKRRAVQEEAKRLIKAFGLDPMLWRLLQAQGKE